jgi:hypothetical protein
VPVTIQQFLQRDLFEFHYWLRYSIAVYGWPLVKAFHTKSVKGIFFSVGSKAVGKGEKDNLRSYRKITGMPQDTVVCKRK